MKYLMLVATDPDHTAADAEAAPDVNDWFAQVTGQGAWLSLDPPAWFRPNCEVDLWAALVELGMAMFPVCPVLPLVLRSGPWWAGWSDRGCGWAVGGAEQAGPGLFPAPVGG